LLFAYTIATDAAARLGTGRKKIIDTLGYPGLAIKGIAAVGPTLDVYGEVRYFQAVERIVQEYI